MGGTRRRRNSCPGSSARWATTTIVRFLTNESLRTPLLRVLAWNFAFALFSVALSFGAGLAVSLLFEDLPGRRLIRALLIMPYPIPVLVSVLIWRSLLNPELGMIGEFLSSVFGSSPQFFLDAKWTRVALILVNIWLSYPYFYIVTSGALRAIPTSSTTPPRSTAPAPGNGSATSPSRS